MVEYPNWVETVFIDEEIEEIEAGDGWSIGMVVDGRTGDTFRALVEHFDDRFQGEVRIYSFEEDLEDYAYETEEEYPGDDSYYVEEYLEGEFA